MSLAILFPGQNSRYPAMLEKLVAYDPANQQIVERASDTLGRNLGIHFRAANPSIFDRNRDVQLGVFLANHMHWQMLERAGLRAEFSAGLSLGEYNHLVHIGALSFEDALRVLAIRGDAYDAAPRGMMMAVFPVAAEEMEKTVVAQGQHDKLCIGMFNTPQQCVLSGERAAVEAAARVADEELFAQSVVVDENLPMHSPLFRSAGEALRPALRRVCWRTPAKPYISNVRGDFVAQATAADFVELLAAHPAQPVRWRECMENLAAAKEGLVFVEAGPKGVLTRFFAKRWLNPLRFSTDEGEDFRQTVDRIKECLGGRTRAASAD